MDRKRNSILSFLANVPLSLLYAIWVLVGLVFGSLFFLFDKLLCIRSDHHADRYYADIPHRLGVILGDIVGVVLAYIAADFLRCRLWMNTSWPEEVPDYGSTLGVHLKMIAFLPIAWPLILYWLGWYQQRWRSSRWRVWNTLAASALLGVSMAALSLLFDRHIYPRTQIGFVVVTLPVVTALVRGISNMASHALGLRTPPPRPPPHRDVW